jgi:hypothetical protein
VAEIKIRRKRHMVWWPLLLLLLIPLAWYLAQQRQRRSGTADLVRDTGSVPAAVPLPAGAEPTLPAPPAGTGAPGRPAMPAPAPHPGPAVTSTDVSTPIGGAPTNRPVPRPPTSARP